MENEKSTGNKYTVKDAAIIGIFCAVMFVVFMVYSTLTGASLFYSMIFNAAGAALILAPFYIYMCMKVGKHGPALVYNIMWAIIAGLMMGPFMIPWFLGGGIIAELSMCGKNASYFNDGYGGAACDWYVARRSSGRFQENTCSRWNCFTRDLYAALLSHRP